MRWIRSRTWKTIRQIRNNLANKAGAADILENLAEDRDEDGEPSNFQAWYVRTANNSRSRDRSDVCEDRAGAGE